MNLTSLGMYLVSSNKIEARNDWKYWKRAYWRIHECMIFIHDKTYNSYEVWVYDNKGYATSLERLTRVQFTIKLIKILKDRKLFIKQLSQRYSK